MEGVSEWLTFKTGGRDDIQRWERSMQCPGNNATTNMHAQLAQKRGKLSTKQPLQGPCTWTNSWELAEPKRSWRVWRYVAGSIM